MVFIVNPTNISKTVKCNTKTLQNTTKLIEKPKVSKIEKAIQGKGMAELCDKLKGLKVKDTMKNIRITM